MHELLGMPLHNGCTPQQKSGDKSSPLFPSPRTYVWDEIPRVQTPKEKEQRTELTGATQKIERGENRNR